MCQDGVVIKALCADSCVCARCKGMLHGCFFRKPKGIVPKSRLKRTVLGISCSYMSSCNVMYLTSSIFNYGVLKRSDSACHQNE